MSEGTAREVRETGREGGDEGTAGEGASECEEEGFLSPLTKIVGSRSGLMLGGLKRLGVESINWLYVGSILNDNHSPQRNIVLKLMIRKPISTEEHERFVTVQRVLEHLDRQIINQQVLYADSITFQIKEITTYAIQLNVYIPGEPLSTSTKEIFPSLSPLQKMQFCRLFSKTLKYIHSQTFPHFGSLHSDGKQESSWQAYIMKELVGSLEHLRVHQIFSEDLLKQVLCFFEESKSIWEYNDTPRLCHMDMHGANILVEVTQGDIRITGILDWEWSIAGCPQMEFLGLRLFYDADAFVKEMEELREVLFEEYGLDPKDVKWTFLEILYEIYYLTKSCAFGWHWHNATKDRFQEIEGEINQLLKKANTLGLPTKGQVNTLSSEY